MDDLKLRIKKLIIHSLMLEELSPADIGDDTLLFGDDGLGLDSVDALELVLEIERQFGVTIDDSAESRRVLASVSSLAQHVQGHRVEA